MTHSWAAHRSTLPMGRQGVPYQSEEVMTMHDKLLRRRQVEEITGMSRSSIYRLMQDGQFPRPVKVSCAAVRWRRATSRAGWSHGPRGEFWPAQRGLDVASMTGTGDWIPTVSASLKFSRPGSPPTAASVRGGARIDRTWRRPARSSCPGYGQAPPLRQPRGCPSAPRSSS